MELEQLDKAARLLGTSATPDALLQTLLTYAREDAGADHALLYTLDDDGHALVPSLIVGRPADDPVKLERFVIGEGASGRAARAKAPIVLGDLAECLFNRQRELMERLGARAAFATPVLGSDGHIIGAIEHHFARPHRPRDIDLYHATVYARLVAAVIERVGFRDQDDVREALALRRRSEISAVASELLASSLDWSKTLDNVARVALPALADLCVVSIADGTRPLARNVAAHVDANEHAELLRLMLANPPSPLEHAVMAMRRAELRVDVDAGGAEDVDEALRQRFHVRSLMALPLIVGNRRLGVMVLCAAASARRYDADDLAIGEMIATRAAQAIERALSYDRMRDAVRARDEFLAIASHDLKNLVSAVKMSSSVLLQRPPSEDRRASRNQIQSIDRVADRMSHLVRDLLDSATIQAGKFAVRRSRQSVRALLQEASTSMRQLAEERALGLEIELPPDDLEVMCDEARIQQVLTNVIGNALKFTPRGTVRVRAWRRDHDVCFEVKDEGIGIAPDDIRRIFERFWRAPGSGHHGVGLGLYIARSIVESHGGSMWAASKLGGGSTFSFTLPLGPSP